MPYTIYTLFNGHHELLYAGRSSMWMRRMEDHVYQSPWFREVASARFQHVETKEEADRLEWRVITEGQPKYNRAQRTPCAKCGGPKTGGRSKFCPTCQATSPQSQRQTGRVRGLTIRCPRCGGIKPPGPAYCPPCKRQVSKDARKLKKSHGVP